MAFDLLFFFLSSFDLGAGRPGKGGAGADTGAERLERGTRWMGRKAWLLTCCTHAQRPVRPHLRLKDFFDVFCHAHLLHIQLPPDVNLARVRLEQARRELMDLDTQLHHGLDLTAT